MASNDGGCDETESFCNFRFFRLRCTTGLCQSGSAFNADAPSQLRGAAPTAYGKCQTGVARDTDAAGKLRRFGPERGVASDPDAAGEPRRGAAASDAKIGLADAAYASGEAHAVTGCFDLEPRARC